MVLMVGGTITWYVFGQIDIHQRFPGSTASLAFKFLYPR